MPETSGESSASSDSPAVVTPTSAGSGAATARNLMLAALVLSFLSLYGHYPNGTAYITIPGQGMTFYSPMAMTQTGFVMKPQALYIIIALAVVFLSGLRENPFLRRWGYWIAFGLLLIFAPINGLLGLCALALTGAAIYFNAKAQRGRPVGAL